MVGTTIVTANCGGISLASGTTLWTRPGATFFRGDPTGVSDPAIYGRNAQGALIAVRPGGALKWRVGTANSDVLAVGPSRLWTQCDGNHVCAVNRTTGARAFRLRFDIGAAPVSLAPNFAILSGLIVNAGNGHIVPDLGSASEGTGADHFAIANGHLIVTGGRVVDVYALAD